MSTPPVPRRSFRVWHGGGPHARRTTADVRLGASAVAVRLPGAALAIAVAALATGLSHVVGLGSGPVLGIALGVIAGTILGPRTLLRPGLQWSASIPLRAAVVVLGAELPLAAVADQGVRSLPGIVVTVGGCLIVARLLGRRLGIPRRLRALIAVGTSICGASAVAAATPVIDADETEVGYAVTTIFLFNVLAVLLFPPLGHALGFGQHAFGVFSGTAVNDLSSVVAAASIYGTSSLHTAVIVKLTRTLMIIPICLVLARRFRPAAAAPAAARGADDDGERHRGAALALRARGAAAFVPGFLVLFVAVAALRGGGVIPAAWAGTISTAATLLITLALSAVGLSIDVSALRRAGLRPLALGAILWVTVSLLSLGCQAAGLL